MPIPVRPTNRVTCGPIWRGPGRRRRHRSRWFEYSPHDGASRARVRQGRDGSDRQVDAEVRRRIDPVALRKPSFLTRGPERTDVVLIPGRQPETSNTPSSWITNPSPGWCSKSRAAALGRSSRNSRPRSGLSLSTMCRGALLDRELGASLAASVPRQGVPATQHPFRGSGAEPS